MDGEHKVLMALIAGLTVVMMSITAALVVVETSHGWFDGGYVTINGHDMRCVVLQVTQTETAASCDWESTR